MFGIYSVEGRHFYESLEALQRVRQVKEAVAPLPVRAGQQETGTAVPHHQVDAYRDTLALHEHESLLYAHQIMSHPVETIHAGVEIITAHQQFQEHHLRMMPVVNDQERVIGMLSAITLLRHILFDGDVVRYIKKMKVAEVMEKEVITADPLAEIRRVARVMHDYHLHGLPIINNTERLVGFISRGDLLRALFDNPPLNIWS
ncbi:MAG: CBS domain-containing protein [Gammaproteobacteria bacterium]|nr:CBS domain-containing protein [Gammaproteobacteria bacterium]